MSSTQLHPVDHRPMPTDDSTTVILTTVEELASLDWAEGAQTLARAQALASHPQLCAHLVFTHRPPNQLILEPRLDQVTVDLPDAEQRFLQALSQRFGSGQECAGSYQRVYRWYPRGHEVRLDAGRRGLSLTFCP